MSQIFDALQRSEAERGGVKPAAAANATELLERAERQALLQWEAGTASDDITRLGFSEAGPRIAPEGIQLDPLGRETPDISEASRIERRAIVFRQFQTAEASRLPGSRLVCLVGKGSPAAEAFRLLKVRLRHLRKDRPLKKLLITSTVPQEGKSFAAANLACTLASGLQESVLLLGGDLRRPSLPELFGVTVNLGICDYLRGERSLTSHIYHLEGPGIWFLPAGRGQDDPLELIQSTRFQLLMGQLGEWFDWIIIDSPPMLPLADTTALARLADGILLVTRRGVTEKKKLKKGLEAFESNKIVGALLNSSNSANDKDYYYYRHESEASEQTKGSLN